MIAFQAKLMIYANRPNTVRIAGKDDILPVGDGIKDKHGHPVTHIAVKKGTFIQFGIASFNHLQQLFGPDAEIWRPERWLDGSMQEDKVRTSTKGFTLYSGLFSFLGGSRSCIGYRFALLEIKVIGANSSDIADIS